MVRVVLLSVFIALAFVLAQVSAERYRIWTKISGTPQAGTPAKAYSVEGTPEGPVTLRRDIAGLHDDEIWEIEFDCASRIVNIGTGQPAHHSSYWGVIVTTSYSVQAEWQVSRVHIENREEMYRITRAGTNLVWTQVRGSIMLFELYNDDGIDWDQLWHLEPIRSDGLLERFKGQ
ncbi:MAG: hypothetical protein BYD32DRAFT_463440 [Podila humilis]|nr:MAG: hypothetical protein BYD32DRAFT_463440 [Podila humilis]